MIGSELARRLHDGRRVFGTVTVSSSPLFPPVVASVGLDFMFIDTEHVPLDRPTLSWMCRTYAALSIAPIVRIPELDPIAACQVLDGGAMGVIAPYVETPEQVIVALDVPGVMGESLDVQIAGNMLTISGSRPALDAAAGNVVHSQDRPVGEFARSFPMPVAVDHNKVEAEVTDGVLTVRLAKAAQARSHSIPVG